VHAHPPQFRYTTSTMQYMYPFQYTYPLLQTCPFQYTSSIPAAAYDNHQHITNQWVRGPEQFIPGEGITSSPRDDRIFRGVVLNTELLPGSCRNLQSAASQFNAERHAVPKHVHWAPIPAPLTPWSGTGGMKHSSYIPQYERNTPTTPFKVYIKFDEHLQIVEFNSITMRANLLLEFENIVALRFPENRRHALRKALEKGYSLVFWWHGFKKRSSVNVRGPSVLHLNAAFTGFLNCVPEGASVMLEWC
jgi:hypothetical protein